MSERLVAIVAQFSNVGQAGWRFDALKGLGPSLVDQEQLRGASDVIRSPGFVATGSKMDLVRRTV
jgi:hypothetical protein